jgi:hypothetical protein
LEGGVAPEGRVFENLRGLPPVVTAFFFQLAFPIFSTVAINNIYIPKNKNKNISLPSKGEIYFSSFSYRFTLGGEVLLKFSSFFSQIKIYSYLKKK